MKLGIIGFGNIATAIVKGILLRNPEMKSEICVSAAHYEKCLANAEKFGITAFRTNRETALAADTVILAVKPYLVKEVVEEIREELRGKMVVCVAATLTSKELGEMLHEETHYIEAIPNTPISVAKGIMNCEETNTLDEKDMAVFRELFEPIAMLEFMKTKDLAVADCLTGCSPAYAAMFIEALGDAGVKNGLTRAMAYRLASRMLEGAGAMAQAENVHPGALKDAVCSPGGKTIKGVASLEESGFRGTIIKAIDAILK